MYATLSSKCSHDQLQEALEQTIVGAGGWGQMSGVTNCN